MIANSDVSNAICTNQLLSIPFDGRWMWDETTRELIYQSSIRNRTMNDKHLKINDELKIDIRTGIIHYRKQSRPFQKIVKTKDNQTISLVDVIQASLNVMSEIFYIPIVFEDYLQMPPVQDFLLYLLNYFYWFFETMNNATPELGKHIDRSESEKSRIRISYAHLLDSLHELASKYAVLLLGINLKDYHHMRNGDLFYSCDNLDRTIYESLWIFSSYFIWITFYRDNFESIRLELARLFRAGGDIDVLKIPSVEVNEEKLSKIDCTQFLARDFPRLEKNHDRSSYYDRKHQLSVSERRNRIRGILTKQMKTRNQSLVEERLYKPQKKTQDKERPTIRRLLNSSFHKNISILPIPTNPLNDSQSLPKIQFELKQNIGILGKSFSHFDPLRLILKPILNTNKIIPDKYLVML